MDVLFRIVCVFCFPMHSSCNAPFIPSMHWKIHSFYVLKFIHICCRLYFSHIIHNTTHAKTHILSTNDAAINNTRENGVDDKNVHFVMYIIKFLFAHISFFVLVTFRYYTHFSPWIALAAKFIEYFTSGNFHSKSILWVEREGVRKRESEKTWTVTVF